MDTKPDPSVLEVGDAPHPELVATYKFIITFETYPNEKTVSEGLERELMDQIDKALAKDFADEVEFLFGGFVKVKVGPLEQGSILGAVMLVLASSITAAEFFSKYKDFYDSFVLLRSQLRAILNRALNRALPQEIYRTVNVTFIPGPATRAVPVIQKEPPQTGSFYSKALLIYLLVMNIVLTVVVIALVYHAVAAMYFKTP